MALLASLCVHFPAYEALGVLADALLAKEQAAKKSTTVEFELAPLGEAKEPEKKPEEEAAATRDKTKPEPDTPQPEPPKLADKVKQPRKEPDEQKPFPQIVPKVEVVPEQPRPPQPRDRPLAVTQKSDDPTVEAPEDRRFIAEENRRVEEETVANIRNMHRDDPDPSASSPRNDPEVEAPGDTDEQEVADLQNVEGSEERTAYEDEAKWKPDRASEESTGEREDMATARAPAQGATQASEAREATRAAGSPEHGGEEETLLVEDASGTFAIRKSKVGRGEGDKGGELQPGAPSPNRGSQRGSRAQNGVDLRLSWSQFEETFGSEQLAQQRETYIAQKRSKARGNSRQRSWRRFRAAIENFVPHVKPGNQTALNTAADPFANYLAVVHRRIHRQFAHGFLRSLPIAGGPFSDRTLMTDLEIIINGDGSLYKVGVIQSSGFLPFDFGAFDSVQKAAPFAAPPRKILSGDGRVYVHWAFYRNERQCGSFNARPFILPNPPGTPDPRRQPGPLRDSDGEGEDDEREPGGPVGPIPYDAEFGALDLRGQRPDMRPVGDARR